MPQLRLGSARRRHSSSSKAAPTKTTTSRRSSRDRSHPKSGGPWLSLLAGDFSVLTCGTDSTRASSDSASTPSPIPRKARWWSKDTTASSSVDAVIVPKLSDQTNTSPGRIKLRQAVATDQHQVSAAVATKWLSGGQTTTSRSSKHPKTSWSSSYYRLQQKRRTENTSLQRSSSRSQVRSARHDQPKRPTGTHLPGEKGRGMSHQREMDAEAKMWKTAVDQESGRTYYYHTRTRETQWQKPTCLATPEERAAAKARETSTRNFFAAMEANILQSINPTQTVQPVEPTKIRTKDSVLARPHGLVRTISTMEDSVLADLVGRVPSNRSILTQTTAQSEDRPESPSFSDVTEDSVSPVKQMRPRPQLRTFGRRSTASLRGSMTRLPLGSRMMKLVPEDIHEDLSGSSHDMIDPCFNESEETVHRGLARSAGTLHLEAGAVDESNRDIVPDLASVFPGISRENSLSLESLTHGSNRNVIRHNHWTHDSFRHPSFSNECNLPTDSSVQSSRYRSQSSLDVGFRADSIRWGGSSLYSKGGECDETLAALAVISQEMVESESRDEAHEENAPKTPISTIDGLEGLNLTLDDDEHELDTEEVESSEKSRPPILRPQSFRAASQEPDPGIARPHMKRRNTCGTLYVGSTMAAPDKDATIKCVCGVFRAHVLRSGTDYGDSYSIFNDLETERGDLSKPKIEPPVPSLDEISQFYRDIFGRAQMEPDCIVISLIYVERLIKVTGGDLRPRRNNWRSILFSCMVLSSKVWDDMSMWNADFSQTCPAGVAFTLQRVNELELAILSALNYQVKVPASEYAKYYFLLRSLLIKSGLGSEDLNTMNPLDVEGAKQLQQVTARYESTATVRKSILGRAKTASTAVNHSNNGPIPQFRGNKVGLEQLVNM